MAGYIHLALPRLCVPPHVVPALAPTLGAVVDLQSHPGPAGGRLGVANQVDVDVGAVSGGPGGGDGCLDRGFVVISCYE